MGGGWLSCVGFRGSNDSAVIGVFCGCPTGWAVGVCVVPFVEVLGCVAGPGMCLGEGAQVLPVVLSQAGLLAQPVNLSAPGAHETAGFAAG